MYCPLSEAWPAFNHINRTEHFASHINQTNQIDDPIKITKPAEENDNHKPTCKDIVEHINNCQECYQKYNKKQYQLTELLALNPQLKETLMIFLIGMLILLILNLLYK